jgi:Spy/CpxP family protein refolding chaperone
MNVLEENMKSIPYFVLLTLVFLTAGNIAAQEPPPPGETVAFVGPEPAAGDWVQEMPGPGTGFGARQMPHGPWWRNSETVKELQLTDAQVSQIEAAFLEHRKSLIDLRADLEHKELDLQTLMEADRPDTAKVSAQIDAVLAARSKLEKSNAMMLLKIRQVLSVEQWKKLQERHHVMRMRAAPGGRLFQRRLEAPGAKPPAPPAPPAPPTPEE